MRERRQPHEQLEAVSHPLLLAEHNCAALLERARTQRKQHGRLVNGSRGLQAQDLLPEGLGRGGGTVGG